MSRALHLTLLGQVLFFTAWGVQLLIAHRESEIVILETNPVDPRDLLSGHYVALTYPVNSIDGCPAGRTLWVRLEQEGGVWRRRECRDERGTDGLWLRGKRRGHAVVFGIERYYVGEENPLRYAQSGQVRAKVAVSRSGAARLLELVPAS